MGECPQRRLDLGQDPVLTVQQDDPDLGGVQAPEAAPDGPYEVVELGDDLDPREAAARHHEGQQLPHQLGLVALDGGFLEQCGDEGGCEAPARQPAS